MPRPPLRITQRSARDDRGTVTIKIMLTVKSAPVRGNMVRNFTVPDARVSEVAEYIRRALSSDVKSE